jgi:ribosomal protein S18 acetylase RimI-like enzyme
VIEIAEVTTLSDGEIADLCEMTRRVVRSGASIGWMRPPDETEAVAYWRRAIRPGNHLLLARENGHVVGTAQLELATRENGRHRAEVNKVLVHPDHQRKGIGLRLMRALDQIAVREGRTLLHLDTNSDDVALGLYRKAGYTEAGQIPDWAASPADNQLHGTTFFYKVLPGNEPPSPGST